MFRYWNKYHYRAKLVDKNSIVTDMAMGAVDMRTKPKAVYKYRYWLAMVIVTQLSVVTDGVKALVLPGALQWFEKGFQNEGGDPRKSDIFTNRSLVLGMWLISQHTNIAPFNMISVFRISA